MVAGVIFYNTKEKNKNSHVAKALFPATMSDNTFPTYTVINQVVESELNPTGKVTFDAENVVRIFSPVDGIVEKVKAAAGDYVKKGQVLAIVHIKELAASNQPITNRKEGQKFQKKPIRTSSRNQLDKHTAEVAEGSSQADNSTYGFRYTIKAPTDGYIVEKNISDEMVLHQNNADNLFTISSLAKVWVLANIYNTDIDKIHPGYDASITTLSYPNQTFSGKVDKVFYTPGQNSKISKIRLAVDNKGYMLKSEMFASITINFAGHEQKPVVPAEAILFDKNKNYVIICTNNNHLSVREVVIYKTLNGVTYLTSGVQPGEKVISKNQIPIYHALKK
jgi:cobalt-zinc-cadmium efflux system membrane fusion protein